MPQPRLPGDDGDPSIKYDPEKGLLIDGEPVRSGEAPEDPDDVGEDKAADEDD